MSKKTPRSDKYRDEIAEIEEGGLHSHEQDVRDRGLVGASTHKNRKSHGRRSPTTSNKASASSGSASKRHNPPRKEQSYEPEE
ncbi:uncharacterized protein N7498_007063 [Penicillium cinerascens]|uniref:Uncharacterized protein n=1 Tax=Penicillium cinerascens TaxID=70096 RepID=A0A9W9JKW0_9EURO|nr:uncharacterized protein N7498_007063 [Penicillium cinerascens]KAJ5197946.1 hypothetical protein N7498_007063 [Penicillium cinerascens]